MRSVMAAQNEDLGVGSVVAVEYDIAGPALYHERYILAVSRHVGWFIVLTPDFDVYPEQLSPSNDDVRDFRWLLGLGGNGGLPGGTAFHRFDGDPLVHADYAAWARDARFQAATFSVDDAPLLAAATVAPLPAPLAPPAVAVTHAVVDVVGETWVYNE